MDSRHLCGALGVASRAASAFLPERVHPGRRARNALRALGTTGIEPSSRFVREVLFARWRSSWLLHRVCRMTDADRGAFLDTRVRIEGELPLSDSRGECRPLILVTPHYGASVIGCLAMARRLRDQRTLSVFYRRTAGNAPAADLLTREGVCVEALLSGVQGAARALVALRRGGCLAMMPDVYQDVTDTMAVPFLGRWLRAAPGAAFLSLRADACLVPAYAFSVSCDQVAVRIGTAIDPRSVANAPLEHALFVLTCLLFADIERELRRAPEHWLQWEMLPRISSALDLPPSASIPDIALALAKRCKAFPPLARQVPELIALAQARHEFV